MTTVSTLQSALAALHTVFPSAVVSVIVDGTTVAALRDEGQRSGELSMHGTDAQGSGMVRVRSDLIRALKIGEQITVDGTTVFVTGDNTDPAGVVRHVSYQASRPLGDDLGVM
jgi:hypothetical protein